MSAGIKVTRVPVSDVGDDVGPGEGAIVGARLGLIEGAPVGVELGLAEGLEVGESEGLVLGACVGGGGISVKDIPLLPFEVVFHKAWAVVVLQTVRPKGTSGRMSGSAIDELDQTNSFVTGL